MITTTQAGLARIETGQTNPQLDTLRQIAEGLSTSVRQLLTGNAVEIEVAADPLVRRIVRVLHSGDADAIETVVNAVDTAETLLRRSAGWSLILAPLPVRVRIRSKRKSSVYEGSLARVAGIFRRALPGKRAHHALSIDQLRRGIISWQRRKRARSWSQNPARVLGQEIKVMMLYGNRTQLYRRSMRPPLVVPAEPVPLSGGIFVAAYIYRN